MGNLLFAQLQPYGTQNQGVLTQFRHSRSGRFGFGAPSGTIANPITDPFSAGVIQTTTANQLLGENAFYDPYFRAYDQVYPDYWRFNEWNREFQQFVANGNLPSLDMIRGLSHDHTGSFSSALGGVNTPELQLITTTPLASWFKRWQTAPTRRTP